MRWSCVVLAASLACAACLSAPPEAVSGGDAGEESTTDGAPGGGDSGAAADAGCTSAGLPWFSDDFSDGDLVWAVMGTNGVAMMDKGVVTGGLEFSPTTTGSDWGYAQTADRFDATGLRFLARVPSVTDDVAALRNYFGLLDDDGDPADDMLFREENGLLRTPFGNKGYSPEAMAWWQVRVGADLIITFETSPDGATWEEFSTGEAGDFIVADVIFEVGIEMETSPASQPGTFRIDDLNLPPDACLQ